MRSAARFQMSIKYGSSHKTLAALLTNVRSFASVISLVNDERGSLCKRFTAFVTRIFSLSCMSYVMSSQQSLACETFPAYFASVWFLSRVGTIVYLEAFGCLEFFATQSAKKPSFWSLVIWSAVNGDFMLFQNGLKLVTFSAHVTFVGSFFLKFGSCRSIEMIQSVVFLQRFNVVKSGTTSDALLIF